MSAALAAPTDSGCCGAGCVAQACCQCLWCDTCSTAQSGVSCSGTTDTECKCKTTWQDMTNECTEAASDRLYVGRQAANTTSTAAAINSRQLSTTRRLLAHAWLVLQYPSTPVDNRRCCCPGVVITCCFWCTPIGYILPAPLLLLCAGELCAGACWQAQQQNYQSVQVRDHDLP